MRKLLAVLGFAVLLISFKTEAQTTFIMKNSKLGKYGGIELSRRILDMDTTYGVMYRDTDYEILIEFVHQEFTKNQLLEFANALGTLDTLQVQDDNQNMTLLSNEVALTKTKGYKGRGEYINFYNKRTKRTVLKMSEAARLRNDILKELQ